MRSRTEVSLDYTSRAQTSARHHTIAAVHSASSACAPNRLGRNPVRLRSTTCLPLFGSLSDSLIQPACSARLFAAAFALEKLAHDLGIARAFERWQALPD